MLFKSMCVDDLLLTQGKVYITKIHPLKNDNSRGKMKSGCPESREKRERWSKFQGSRASQPTCTLLLSMSRRDPLSVVLMWETTRTHVRQSDTSNSIILCDHSPWEIGTFKQNALHNAYTAFVLRFYLVVAFPQFYTCPYAESAIFFNFFQIVLQSPPAYYA